MKRTLAFLSILLCITLQGREYSVSSPDRQLKITLSQNGSNQLTYSFSAHGKTLVNPSIIGMTDKDGAIPTVSGFTAAGGKQKVRGVWKPLWGKCSEVPDRYNARSFKVHFSSPIEMDAELEVRAYDDGAAFRMIIPRPAAEMYEYTEYGFAGDYTAWYYNGEYHNLGPEKLSESEGTRKPVMTIKASEHQYLALHEAFLSEDSWPITLKTKKGSCTFQVVPKKISTESSYRSAWRVILCADEPGGLVDSHMLELLNPDPTGDFSWVKPGVCLWDWRIDGAVWGDFHYGMNYQSWVKMIDFAAEQGFSHLVLDANWYGAEFEKDSDPVKGEKARDVQRIIRYGKDKGVGVWLYLNDVAGTNYPIEETLAQYEKWGASGVKYGFMQGSAIEKHHKTLNITALCAKHHLMVDYHDGPVHPFGQMRTFPNAITREFCQAQLDAKRFFYPKTFVTSVFVNMVAGPIDMNNGFMELHQGPTTRVDNNQELPSTATAEIARTLITWSGATIIPDIPEYYRKYPELLRFLAAEKQPWRNSKTLAGEIGEYIVMMRQNADGDYLVAAATNEDERDLTVDLSFLEKGITYKAQVNQDAAGTSYLASKEGTSYEEKEVTRLSGLKLHLAQGGGACVLIKAK